MAQTLLTVLIVAGSAAYVLWALLLPAAVRRRMAQALLRWPLHLPTTAKARLQALAQAPSACGCDGCDRRPTPAPPQGGPQPMHWTARRKR